MIIALSGAGSGIGKSTAEALAEQGHRLILTGRSKEKLEAVKLSLKGNDHQVIACDTTDKESLAAGIDAIRFDSVDAVIANAATGGRNIYGKDDRWDEIINTNLKGTYIFVNEFLPLLRKSGSTYRHVVVISSILASLGVPEHSAYSASKAGVLGMMRSWAAEWATDKILVNAIAPGWVETEMAMEGIQGYAEKAGKSFSEAMKEQMSLVLLQKMSKPSEIAGFIQYLLTSGQTSITGQTFHVNNGAIMP